MEIDCPKGFSNVSITSTSEEAKSQVILGWVAEYVHMFPLHQLPKKLKVLSQEMTPS